MGRPGALLGAPEALLAPPGRLLGPSGRLESRVLPKSRISSTVQRFSWFLGGQGGLLAPPGALLEPSWRPLGPSWRLLGCPWPSLVALGWLLAGPSGSRVVLGWLWPRPLVGPGSPQLRGPRDPVRVHCIDIYWSRLHIKLYKPRESSSHHLITFLIISLNLQNIYSIFWDL